MPDNAIEALLECWSRFIKAQRWRPQSCGSAEKYYRPERVADDQTRVAQIREFQTSELWKCERAVSGLPLQYATLLRLVWLFNISPPAAIRKAKLTPLGPRAWPAHRNAAFEELRQRLR